MPKHPQKLIILLILLRFVFKIDGLKESSSGDFNSGMATLQKLYEHSIEKMCSFPQDISSVKSEIFRTIKNVNYKLKFLMPQEQKQFLDLEFKLFNLTIISAKQISSFCFQNLQRKSSVLVKTSFLEKKLNPFDVYEKIDLFPLFLSEENTEFENENILNNKILSSANLDDDNLVTKNQHELEIDKFNQDIDEQNSIQPEQIMRDNEGQQNKGSIIIKLSSSGDSKAQNCEEKFSLLLSAQDNNKNETRGLKINKCSNNLTITLPDDIQESTNGSKNTDVSKKIDVPKCKLTKELNLSDEIQDNFDFDCSKPFEILLYPDFEERNSLMTSSGQIPKISSCWDEKLIDLSTDIGLPKYISGDKKIRKCSEFMEIIIPTDFEPTKKASQNFEPTLKCSIKREFDLNADVELISRSKNEYFSSKICDNFVIELTPDVQVTLDKSWTRNPMNNIKCGISEEILLVSDIEKSKTGELTISFKCQKKFDILLSDDYE